MQVMEIILFALNSFLTEAHEKLKLFILSLFSLSMNKKVQVQASTKFTKTFTRNKKFTKAYIRNQIKSNILVLPLLFVSK